MTLSTPIHLYSAFCSQMQSSVLNQLPWDCHQVENAVKSSPVRPSSSKNWYALTTFEAKRQCLHFVSTLHNNNKLFHFFTSFFCISSKSGRERVEGPEQHPHRHCSWSQGKALTSPSVSWAAGLRLPGKGPLSFIQQMASNSNKNSPYVIHFMWRPCWALPVLKTIFLSSYLLTFISSLLTSIALQYGNVTERS